MQGYFGATMYGLVVRENMGRGDRIAEDLFLTNDPETKKAIVPEDVALGIGGLEASAFVKAPTIAYGRFPVSGEPDNEWLEKQNLRFMFQLKMFQTTFWLFRDNAVSFDLAFVTLPGSRGTGAVSINRWDGTCYAASGKREVIEISRDDLRQVREGHRTMSTLFGTPDSYGASEPLRPDVPRPSRALFFVQGARSTPVLSVKVALYCSALESLLVTDGSELTHKLSERLAYLLGGEDPATRRGVFERMKSAYGIRSRAIHGSSVKKSKLTTDLHEAALACDEFTRRALQQIFGNERLANVYLGAQASDEAIEGFFADIVIGARRQEGTQP
jgi:hypothetical protein